MDQTELQKALVMGVVLGVVAGAVVWFLERFQSNRLAEELRASLGDLEAVREWLGQRPPFPRGGAGGAGGLGE